MSAVVTGMDPHKRSATIEVMDRDETVPGRGRYGTGQSGYRAMVRAVRHRPVISPDDLSSGVYTSRRAARWATGHGGVLSRSEKRRRSGGGERFRCPT